MILRALRLTPRLRTQLARVERAAATCPSADVGWAPLEQEQQRLGRMVTDAYEAQRTALAPRLARLPTKAVRMVPAQPKAAPRGSRRRA